MHAGPRHRDTGGDFGATAAPQDPVPTHHDAGEGIASALSGPLRAGATRWRLICAVMSAPSTCLILRSDQSVSVGQVPILSWVRRRYGGPWGCVSLTVSTACLHVGKAPQSAGQDPCQTVTGWSVFRVAASRWPAGVGHPQGDVRAYAGPAASADVPRLGTRSHRVTRHVPHTRTVPRRDGWILVPFGAW